MAESHDQPIPEPSPKRNGDRDLSQWYRVTGIGVEFVVAVLLFGGIGWWLDSRLSTTPWLMIGGAIVGFVVGLWLMLKTALRSFHD